MPVEVEPVQELVLVVGEAGGKGERDEAAGEAQPAVLAVAGDPVRPRPDRAVRYVELDVGGAARLPGHRMRMVR